MKHIKRIFGYAVHFKWMLGCACLLMLSAIVIDLIPTKITQQILDNYISDYAAASNGFDLGKYINFSPVPLAQYFASDTIIGEYFDKTKKTPSIWPSVFLLSFTFS